MRARRGVAYLGFLVLRSPAGRLVSLHARPVFRRPLDPAQHPPPAPCAIGIDQIPEALLPLLALQDALVLSLPQIAAITAAFFLLEIPLAWLSHRLGLRERPY